MEPAGIEPATSCLQNDTANGRGRPDSHCLSAISALLRKSRCGRIRCDRAGFGQRIGAAAQTDLARSCPGFPSADARLRRRIRNADDRFSSLAVAVGLDCCNPLAKEKPDRVEPNVQLAFLTGSTART